nr:reverse transcriptase domain-containing protein [Tanacetum cinerariifolium]
MLKYKNVSHDAIKLVLFPFSLEGAARTWLEKEPPRSIHIWEDLVSKFVNYFFPPSKTMNLKNDITNFQQKFDETFSEAWDRFKNLLRKCPHHGFSELHQIDTIYNALTKSDQDSLNVTASGNLLNHTPRDALTIIENKSKVCTSRNKLVVSKVNTTTSSSSPSPDITALTDIVKESVLMTKANQQASEVEREPKVTKDKVQTISSKSTAHIQPLVFQVPILKPKVVLKPYPKSSIPYPSRLNDQKLREKTNSQMLMFLQIFQRLHFDLSFVDALLYITKFISMFKSLLSNKEKLFKLENTPLTENFSTKKLSLLDLTPTRMTLELATRLLLIQLETARAIVDVHSEELILRDSDEKLIFHAHSTSKHPHKYGNESIKVINFINITCEDGFPKVLNFKKLNHPSSGSTTPLSDFSPSFTPFETSDSLLEEFAHELALLDLFLPRNKDENFDYKADRRKIKHLLNQDPSTESDVKIIDPILEKFTDEPAINYSPPPGDDDDDDILDLMYDNDEWKKLSYGDCYKDFDYEKDKNKDSKMKSLVVEAHIVESNVLLP